MTSRRSALALLALALPFAFLGCRRGAEGGGPYKTRGVIRNIARPDGKPVLLVHHEPISDFVSRDGRKKGMASMAMPFGVAPEVSLDSLQPEDRVELTFTVDWERYPPSIITALDELPSDTSLQLSPL